MAAKPSIIVTCNACGAKNKIPPEKSGTAARCGKCGAPLQSESAQSGPGGVFLLRCTECGAKNRVPQQKIKAGPKCGKCGAPLQTEDLFVREALMITDGNFEDKVLKSPLPVLMFAWAPWCPSCRAAMPVIDGYAATAAGKVRVGKLNVEAAPILAQRYNILSVPFIFIFDNGQLKESLPGAVQQHELMMKMARYI